MSTPPLLRARPVIAAFDFDGTITTKDTFLPFLCRAFGRRSVAMSLARLAWPALKVWLGLTSRDHFKALLIARLFPDAPVARLKQLGREHASHIASLCRPAALNQIKWHQDQGHHLIMVSASLDFYLEPLARQLGFKNLLCTEVASCNGVCTGQIRGENCRASAKVRRLEELLGPLHQYEIHAYGDSDGDAEMLAISDHPAFKPFRKAR